jgi:FlaG/FlaF family flagellin (archaellin)
MGIREDLIADAVMLFPGHTISGTTLVDLSGTQNGTITGDPFWTIQHNSKQRLGLNYNATGKYSSVAYNASHAVGTGAMFVGAWVRPVSSIASLQAIMARDELGNRDWTFGFGLSSGKMLYQDNGTVYESTVVVTLDALQHLAVKRVGTTLTFYRNGTSAGTATVSATNYNKSIAVQIGRRNFTSSEIPITGIIADPILLPRDITPDELAWISTSTNYFFDIASGTTRPQHAISQQVIG